MSSSDESVSPLLSDLICSEAVAGNKFNQSMTSEVQLNRLITFEVRTL